MIVTTNSISTMRPFPSETLTQSLLGIVRQMNLQRVVRNMNGIMVSRSQELEKTSIRLDIKQTELGECCWFFSFIYGKPKDLMHSWEELLNLMFLILNRSFL